MRPVILIGSRRDCDLPLNEPSVSQVHCAIVNNGRSILVCDLCSRSGTHLNGRRVRVAALSPGDVLRIGSVTVAVEFLRAPTGSADEAHAKRPPHALTLALDGRQVEITQPATVIGRRAGCDLVLDTPDVSLTHALIFTLNDSPAVCDLGSRSGTFLNGEPILLAWLHDADRLTIGGEQAVVSWAGATGHDRAEPDSSSNAALGKPPSQSLRPDTGDELGSAPPVAAAGRAAGAATGLELERRCAQLDQRESALRMLADRLAQQRAEQESQRELLAARAADLERREQALKERRTAAELADAPAEQRPAVEAMERIRRLECLLHQLANMFAVPESPASASTPSASQAGRTSESNAGAADELPAPVVDRPLFVPPEGTPPEAWPPELRARLNILRRVSGMSERDLVARVLAEFRSQVSPPPPREPDAGEPEREGRWWA